MGAPPPAGGTGSRGPSRPFPGPLSPRDAETGPRRCPSLTRSQRHLFSSRSDRTFVAPPPLFLFFFHSEIVFQTQPGPRSFIFFCHVGGAGHWAQLSLPSRAQRSHDRRGSLGAPFPSAVVRVGLEHPCAGGKAVSAHDMHAKRSGRPSPRGCPLKARFLYISKDPGGRWAPRIASPYGQGMVGVPVLCSGEALLDTGEDVFKFCH